MTFKGKNIIVTGATGAIGKALVTAMLRRGASLVVLACRNAEKAGKMVADAGNDSARLLFIPLDLSDFSSVDSFARQIKTLGIKVDGLFNNAGHMPHSLQTTVDDNEMATQVNYLSPVLLTRSLFPMMSRGAFVVMTTSITRKLFSLHGDNPVEWNKSHFSRYATYGRSKRLLTHSVTELNREFSSLDIRVNCADPGVVNSDMVNVNKFVDPIADILFRPFIRSADKGAIPALRAAEATTKNRIYTLRRSRPIDV